jgi:hypothetical protein
VAAGVRTGPTPQPRVYRRTRGARLLAAAAAALAAHLLAEPTRPGTGRGLAACGALFILSGLLVVSNFGDRVEVGEEGVRVRNIWREKLGIGRPHLLRWEEVEEVHDLPAPLRAFVVRTRAGRRVVFDSIDGIEEVAEEFRRRLPLSAPDPGGPP